jgi:hypothetical protein
MIEAMFSTPFSPGIRPSDSSFHRAREPSVNRNDRSDPAGFAHSFDQRTWAHELAENNRLQSAFESRSGIGRYKRVIGDALRSREDARRECEVKIAVKALNRMLELGRPVCTRVA